MSSDAIHLTGHFNKSKVIVAIQQEKGHLISLNPQFGYSLIISYYCMMQQNMNWLGDGCRALYGFNCTLTQYCSLITELYCLKNSGVCFGLFSSPFNLLSASS